MKRIKHKIQDNAPRIWLTAGYAVVIALAIALVLCRNAWGGF